MNKYVGVYDCRQNVLRMVCTSVRWLLAYRCVYVCVCVCASGCVGMWMIAHFYSQNQANDHLITIPPNNHTLDFPVLIINQCLTFIDMKWNDSICYIASNWLLCVTSTVKFTKWLHLYRKAIINRWQCRNFTAMLPFSNRYPQIQCTTFAGFLCSLQSDFVTHSKCSNHETIHLIEVRNVHAASRRKHVKQTIKHASLAIAYYYYIIFFKNVKMCSLISG